MRSAEINNLIGLNVKRKISSIKEIDMEKSIIIILFALFLLSCGNKSREAEPIIFDNQPVVERSEPDTISVSVKEEADKMDDGKGKIVDGKSKREDVKAPVSSSSSSSSRSHKSSGYDNMRGFDPASEDDMDDNGMSRYMENDDDEGWD